MLELAGKPFDPSGNMTRNLLRLSHAVAYAKAAPLEDLLVLEADLRMMSVAL